MKSKKITIEMAKDELPKAEACLTALGARDGLDLALIVAKNKRIIEAELRDIKEAIKPRYDADEEKRQRAYDEAVFKLQRQHRADPEKHQDEFSALQLEYADEMFRRDLDQRKAAEFLRGTIAVDVYEIPKSLLPATLRADELGPMVLAVVDDDDEAEPEKDQTS